MKVANLSRQSHSHKAGLFGNLVTTAEYVGASYLYGRNAVVRPRIGKMPTDLAVGVALKAASLLMCVMGKGASLCPHLDVVGNAGIGAYAHSLGAQHGAKAAGVTRLVLPKGADPMRVKAMVPGSEVLGAIEPAAPGRVLTVDDLQRLAR